MNKNVISLVLLLAAVFIAGYCHGQASIGSVYHNTCARYNGYYNARNKMNKGNKNAAKSLQDDYSKLLPVDKTELNTASASPDLDSIIIRLTIVNKLHPKSKWVDDCNMLIGKAYYMKKDYLSASEMFQYIVASKRQKKTKSDNVDYSDGKKLDYDGVTVPWPKPVKKINLDFLKHKSIRYEALLWLISSYMKLNKKDEAETIITLVEKNNDAIEFQYRGKLEARKAQFMIDQKRYADAVRPLIYAIALTTDDKPLRTRYVYILAQLYQLLGNSDKSIKTFKEVLTLQTDYKMQFFANINIAKSYSSNSQTSAAEVMDILNKLIDNEKYSEFRDQVYYAIAEINLKQNNKDLAKENLNKSIRASVNNGNQKGLSYLKLGELAFDDQYYPVAKKYYDSTLSFINKDYKDITAVKERASVLNTLVTQMNVIQVQDSLLKLANMSDKDREAAIADALERIQREKEEAAALQKSLATQAYNPQGADAVGGWYFYNSTVMASGITDFTKKWGTRKLEDNWRRADKRSDNGADNSNTETEEDADASKKKEGAITRQTLLDGIPMTDDKKKEAVKKITAAYYKLGSIYKDELASPKKATEILETLESKYPGNDYESLALYQLYLLYSRSGDMAKADVCKQKILKDYPTSPVAKCITDPNYAANSKNMSDPVEAYYQHALSLYQQRKYADLYRVVDSSRILYPANTYAAKFDLLRTFGIAQTASKDSFKTALTNFTKKYTTGEEQKEAKDMLAYLAKNNIKDKKVNDAMTRSDFVYNPNTPQFLVILFDETKPSNQSIVDSLNKYDRKFHPTDNLKPTTMILDDKRQLISVKQFKNSTLAMKYYKEIEGEDNDMLTHVETTYHVFVIDDKNFSIFFKNKNIEEYMAFFDKNYH